MLASLAPALALALAAAPAVTVVPSQARPGDAVLVRLAGAEATPSGEVLGRPLRFWRAGKEWRALAALPTEARPGRGGAAVTAGGARAEATLEIVEPGFASKALSLPPRFVAPPPEVKARLDADRRAFAAAWDEPFGPPRFSRAFAWPRKDRLTGRFGDQRVLNGKTESVHYGVDLGGPRGAPVLAANDGVVALARDCYLSGRSVVLSHGAGVFTVYFHLDRILVKVGQKVRRGERVGRVGSTGRSTGPHLHFSARVDGLYVDPESLLAIDFPAGTAPPRPARTAPAPVPPAEVPPAPPGTPGEPAAAPAEAAETAGPARATASPPR